jgi:hypothetical protein
MVTGTTHIVEEGDNRPPVYWEDGRLIIRASAIGNPCLWELIAAGQGYEPATLPEFLAVAFAEGHALEPIVIAKLQENGMQFESHQQEGHLDIEDVPVSIRYHPDGIGTDLFGRHVVEVKALRNEVWQKARRSGVGSLFAEYPWQLSTMMIAEGLPGEWVAINKGNKDNSFCEEEGKLLRETVALPPISYEDICDKAKRIYEGVMGPDVLKSGRECDNPNHFPCRYIHLRPEPEEDQIKEFTEAEKEELDYLLKAYLTFKGTVDEAKQRQDEIRNQIIAIAGDTKKIITDAFIAPISQAYSTTTDWASMERDGIDVEKYRTKTPGVRYLKNVKKRI